MWWISLRILRKRLILGWKVWKQFQNRPGLGQKVYFYLSVESIAFGIVILNPPYFQAIRSKIFATWFSRAFRRVPAWIDFHFWLVYLNLLWALIGFLKFLSLLWCFMTFPLAWIRHETISEFVFQRYRQAKNMKLMKAFLTLLKRVGWSKKEQMTIPEGKGECSIYAYEWIM